MRNKNADAVAATVARTKATKENPAIKSSVKPRGLVFNKSADGSLEFVRSTDLATTQFKDCQFGLCAVSEDIAAYDEMDDKSRVSAEETVRGLLTEFPSGTELHIVDGVCDEGETVTYRSVVNYIALGTEAEESDDVQIEEPKTVEGKSTEAESAESAEEPGEASEESAQAEAVEGTVETRAADTVETPPAPKTVETAAAETTVAAVPSVETKTDEPVDDEAAIVATIVRIFAAKKLSTPAVARVFVKLADALIEQIEGGDGLDGSRETQRIKNDVLVSIKDVQKLLDSKETSVTSDDDGELDDLSEDELAELVKEILPDLREELKAGAEKGAQAAIDKARGRV